MPLHPGTYIQRRREAAGLTVDQVAERIATEPRMAEHGRARWVRQIEAGNAPASFATIVALRSAFPFDLQVLATLEAIRLGREVPPPRLCCVCACSEHDPCVEVVEVRYGPAPARQLEHHCSWAAENLCSACIPADAAVMTA